MIVVKLMGGLGNQMFQYAAGRALSLKHDSALVLDTSFFNGDQANHTPREFQLDRLRLGSVQVSPAEIPADAELPLTLLERLKDAGWKIFASGPKMYRYRERSYLFQEEFFRLPDNVYLDGYWQSQRYFMHIEEVIREEFKPAFKPSDINLIRDIGYRFRLDTYKARGLR